METVSIKFLRELLSVFREAVQLVKELQRIIKETPEVVEFLRLCKREYSAPLLPIQADCLIYASEAAKVLHVSKNMIGTWEKQGLLRAYYTPGGKNKKYWMSEVKKMAKVDMEKLTGGNYHERLRKNG